MSCCQSPAIRTSGSCIAVTVTIPGQSPILIVSMFDGVKAWASNPMSGSDAMQEVSGAEAEIARDQSDFDGALLDYKAKGNTVELIGTESLGARKAHHLKVTRKGQAAQHYYIDVETGLELKITTEAGAGPASEMELSDYRSVSGVQVPHLLKVSQGGTLQGELRLEKVEFNVPMADTLFKGR